MTQSLPWWREPTRAQWLSFGAAWVGWLLDAFDFTVFLLVMPQIAAEFGVPLKATAGSVTLTLLMRLFGGLVAGAAADRFGRKLPLMVSIAAFALCDGAVAFAPTFTWVLILRTVYGFAMGAEWTSGAALAMESWPPRSRGVASGLLQGSFAVGYLLAGVACALVVPRFGWRAIFVVAAAPVLLVLPVRLLVRESAEWKARVGAVGESGRSKSQAPALRWACAVMVFAFAGYYGLTALYPTLLATELGRSMTEKAWLVAAFNVGMLLGTFVFGLLATARGPVWALRLSAGLTVLALPLYVGALPSLLGPGALLAGLFCAGSSGVTPVLLTALFPAQVRARAMGFCYHVGAFGSAVVPLLITELASRGLKLSGAMVCVCAAAELLLVLTLMRAPAELRPKTLKS